MFSENTAKHVAVAIYAVFISILLYWYIGKCNDISEMNLVEYNNYLVDIYNHGPFYERLLLFRERLSDAISYSHTHAYRSPCINSEVVMNVPEGYKVRLFKEKSFSKKNILMSAYDSEGEWFYCSIKTISSNSTNNIIDYRYVRHQGWVKGSNLLPAIGKNHNLFKALQGLTPSYIKFLLRVLIALFPFGTLMYALLELSDHSDVERQFIMHDIYTLIISLLLSIAVTFSIFIFARCLHNNLHVNSPYGNYLVFSILGVSFSVLHSPVNWIRILFRPIGYRPISIVNGRKWWGMFKLIVMCIPWLFGIFWSVEAMPIIIHEFLLCLNIENITISILIFIYSLICSTISLMRS